MNWVDFTLGAIISMLCFLSLIFGSSGNESRAEKEVRLEHLKLDAEIAEQESKIRSLKKKLKGYRK